MPRSIRRGTVIDIVKDDRGGAIKANGDGAGGHAKPRIVLKQDLEKWQVSTSLFYGRWTLLGSPWDMGPLACDMNA